MSNVPTTCDLLIHSGDVIEWIGRGPRPSRRCRHRGRIVAVGDHLDLLIDAASKIDASDSSSRRGSSMRTPTMIARCSPGRT